MVTHPNRPDKAKLKSSASETAITSYKGFGSDFSCLGYKFEVGAPATFAVLPRPAATA